MENYNFEFMELNRSLHVHYQEGKNSKGEGAGRGCMPQIFVIAVMDQYTSVYSKTVVNRKMSYYYGNAEDALVTNKYQ